MKRIIHIIKQYDIVLTAFKPALARVILISIGIAIGMIVTYLFAPTAYRNNAVPAQLDEVYRDQWVKDAANGYVYWTQEVSPNVVEGGEQFTENVTAELSRKLADVGYSKSDVERLRRENEATEPILAANLDAIRSHVNDDAAQKQKDEYGDPGFLSAIWPIILYILVVIVAVLIAVGQVMFDPWIKLKNLILRPDVDPALLAERERRKAASEAAKDKSTFDTPPVVQFMSTYLGGDNFYDDSFAIEMEDNTFLGECGAGIAETIGVGDPKKVTAIEAWIFDKNDIQTITHLLMSEHAYNDEALRAKLAARGEPVLAEPGATTTLETQTLRAEVRVKSVEYGDSALPSNSFFDRLIVEIAVWQKEGSPDLPGGSGGGGPSLPPPLIDIPDMATEPPAPKPVQPLPQTQPQQPMPPQQPPQGGPPPQQRPPQGMPPPQQRPPQGMPPPQQRPPQGMPPPQARPPQGMPPPQQRPPQGMPPPQQRPPQGPPPGAPPQQRPPQIPLPPQARPPQGGPPPPRPPQSGQDSPFGDTGEVDY